MKHIICLLLAFILGGMVLAGSGTASICSPKETVIFFGNGVMSPKKKAHDSKNAIRESLRLELPQEEFELWTSNSPTTIPTRCRWTCLNQPYSF